MGVKGVGYSISVEKHDFSDVAPALDEAERMGVETVEVPIYAMNLVTGGRVLEDRVQRLAGLLAGRPFEYTLHGVLGINFMDEPYRLPLHEQVLRSNIAIAAALHAEHLVIHTGHCPNAEAAALDAAYERQRECLTALGDEAAEEGVILCVENVFDFSGRHTASPSRLAAELAAIDHPSVRATIDFSHAALHCGFAGADVVEEVAKLAPFARHLHIHDSFGRPDGFWVYHKSEALAFGIGDLHLPLGYGDLPWERFIAECRFPDRVCFNIELDTAYWPELADTIARTRDLANRAIVATEARAAAE
jgi:sugar phosphate isomerase/epimerase